MLKIVQLEDFVSNFDHLIDSAFWSGEGEFKAFLRTAPEEVVERALDADALLINKTVINSELLKQLPRLKYIGILATGYNVVDLESCRAAGVAVTNVPSYSTDSVAQHTFALLLNLAREVELHARYDWSTSQDFCQVLTPQLELTGKTLGVVGFGAIARKVTEIALVFGMKVAVYTRTPGKVDIPGVVVCQSFEELLPLCDVLSFHCPLFKENEKMLNSKAISLMKEGAIVLNTARGGLIDENALREALDSGKISGAGVDVLSVEPPPADHPLLHHPRCRITPHTAWATVEARMRLFNTARENLRSFISGGTLNRLV